MYMVQILVYWGFCVFDVHEYVYFSCGKNICILRLKYVFY